jgi:hypothetical protein
VKNFGKKEEPKPQPKHEHTVSRTSTVNGITTAWCACGFKMQF